ncbi:hypothetical protein GCM10011583_55100 [Streptomyces camponoticapitis]|uniref:Secreted protein n=1 Tax=Streptomyces camponoticapitis TaxID=1616125 RepID=A0ABQ2EM22_9ACTN|nr:hypothetical protein GCM10011583_55100 [Streptomyces camponoticapitis]
MRRFTAVTVAGAAATIVIGLAAAPASAQAPSSHSQGQVGTLGFSECTDILSSVGYTVTKARAGWCAVGTIGTPTAWASCSAGLATTWVIPAIAGAACTGALVP